MGFETATSKTDFLGFWEVQDYIFNFWGVIKYG